MASLSHAQSKEHNFDLYLPIATGKLVVLKKEVSPKYIQKPNLLY